MEFRFDPDVLDLRDGARAFFEGENTSARLRTLAGGGDPLALWPQIAGMGLLGMAVSESSGGLGLSGADQMLLCEEAGRSGLPEPLSEVAAIIIPALSDIGGASAERISGLCDGRQRACLVHPLVPFANHAGDADFILHMAPGCVTLADRGHFTASPRESIDPGRKLSKIELKGGIKVLEGQAADRLVETTAFRGASATAAELCGLADRMIRLATEYSRTRIQFGSPIGSFQAVKHLLANAQVKLEFSRPAVYRAGSILDSDGQSRAMAVAHAKIAAGDAALIAAENAIQVFGGMGYTFEVDLHFFMKRAWALCGQWGERNLHMKTVDAGVFSGEGCIGPGSTFARSQVRE